MKTILHLHTGELSAEAKAILEAQQKKPQGNEIQLMKLTVENAPEALHKIFEMDTVCVWPPEE